jgi:hypothetical protein
MKIVKSKWELNIENPCKSGIIWWTSNQLALLMEFENENDITNTKKIANWKINLGGHEL